MARELPSVDLDEIEVDDTPSAKFLLGGEEWFIRSREAVDQAALSQAMATGNLTHLIRAIIVPDQVDDLLTVVAKPDMYTGARADALQKLMMEAFADRPTRRSSTSGRGPSKTGRTSRAASSSEDAPPEQRAG